MGCRKGSATFTRARGVNLELASLNIYRKAAACEASLAP
jgi:hypothetical protein